MMLRCAVLTGPRFLRDVRMYEAARFDPTANILRCLDGNNSWLLTPIRFFETCHVEVDRRALMDDGNIMCVLNEVGGASWPCKGSCRVHGTSTEANHFRGRGLCVGQWCTLGRGPRDFQESSQCCIPQAKGATQKEISSVNFLKSVVEWLWFASTSKKSGSWIFPCKSVRVKKKTSEFWQCTGKISTMKLQNCNFRIWKSSIFQAFLGTWRHGNSMFGRMDPDFGKSQKNWGAALRLRGCLWGVRKKNQIQHHLDH